MKKIKSNREKAKTLLLCAAVFTGLTSFCVWQNNDIVVTSVDYRSAKIPAEFDGYTIVQISDLHNKRFGAEQRRLLKHIEKAEPDIIFVTGDLIDAGRTDINAAMELIDGAVKLAHVYYVSGNHEARSGVYAQLRERLLRSGTAVLDNEAAVVEVNGARLNLIGLADPAFGSQSGDRAMREMLDTLRIDDGLVLNILLSHRPEFFGLYAGSGMDLVFSGHAHGGQIRLPFVGGLIAPGQGFFPKYTSDAYKQDGATMAVSRGLGNSIAPVRVFNRPEVVVTTLHSDG
jgi:predicted MPP superfamily phosphohydrolase